MNDFNETNENIEKKRSLFRIFGKEALLLLRDVLAALAVVFIFLQFFGPTIIFEQSMENTLHPNDYVFLAKKAYVFGEPKRGDIVVFHSDITDGQGGTKNLIKRIVGLPGETVEIKEGSVWIDGEALVEDYTLTGQTLGEMQALDVPNGFYFVLGDNRDVSRDSRSDAVGCVSEDLLLGKVVFRLLPIKNIGVVK